MKNNYKVRYINSSVYYISINGVEPGCLVNLNPFNNCQIFSIAGFDVLIEYKEEDNLLEIVKCLHEKLYPYPPDDDDDLYDREKPLMIIDVNAKYSKLIEKNFNECINSSLPYTSTNGSKMIIYIIEIWKNEDQNDL